MDKINLTINRLPAPTWRHLRLNESRALVALPRDACEPRVELEGSVCLNKKQLPRVPGKNCCGCERPEECPVQAMDFAAIPTGLGAELEKLGGGKRLHLTADCGRSVAALTLRYDDGQQSYNDVEIEAKPGSELTVYMTFIAPASASGMAAARTKLALARDAKVKLVQVQLLGRGFAHLNDVGADLSANASFELLQLELGAGEIYNGARAELRGEGAAFDAALAYYGRHGQKLDFNFIANHYGRKTTSEMSADGVLAGGARKLYRGTIDFKNGCAGATGDEKESVLLLTDDVANQSIPLILCSEEDVQGNHGASIGKLDEELLFYMMSRGLAEADAVAMLARSKIEGVCRRMEDDAAVQLVERYLEGVISDAG